MTPKEEMQIINKVLNGGTNAFEALVIEHQSKVFSLALRMVKNREDAEDLAQEAFIRAYNALPGFKGQSSFYSWLYRLTTNICIDFLRSSKNKSTISLTLSDDERENEVYDIPDERFNPENEAVRAELRELIGEGLEKLSPEYREILLLRETGGLSYTEISKQLNISEGTVKSRIFRARQKLILFLSENGNISDFISS